MDDWYLQRQGHPDCRHHLNILLGTREKLTIGRKALGAVDIVCNGKTVSREHCILKYEAEHWTVEDLKSMNGVYLNRSRIPANIPTSIQEGSILGVGALDVTDPDYYVFDVLKNSVKTESESGDLVRPVEVPSSAAETISENPPGEISKASALCKGMLNLRENSNDIPNDSAVVASAPMGVESVQRCSVNVSPEERPREQPLISDRQNIQEEVVPAQSLPVTAENYSELLDPLQQAGCKKVSPTLNQRESNRMSSTSPNSRYPSFEDMKLKLNCRVVIERLPKGFLVISTNGTPKTQAKKRVEGKRCLLQYDTDSESEGEDIHKVVNRNPRNSSVRLTSKGKDLEKFPKLEEPTSSLEDYSDDGFVACTSNAPSDHSVVKSKFVVERLCSSTSANGEQRTFFGNVRTKNNIPAVPSMRIDNSEELSGDCEVLEVESTRSKRVDDYPDTDDDVIILSSGDENTFSSQPRFKQESPDSPIGSSAVHNVAKLLLTNEIVASNSSDEDSRFFPELSQAFLNEIAAEEEADEEETNLSKKISRKGTDVDKLNTLVKSGRFNAKGKTTLPTEPLVLSHPPRGRFTLATACTSARRETGIQSEPEEIEDQPKKKTSSNEGTPRTLKTIPVRPQVGRKRKYSNNTGSIRDKMCKDQGMESYLRSVHDANKKTGDGPCTSSPAILVPLKKNIPPKTRIEVPKVTKSSMSNPVKAKVTKKSRGDMFLKDLVGEEPIPKEVAKKGSTSALAGFSIPKLSKSVAEPLTNGQDASHSATEISAHKRKYPDDDALGQAVADSVDDSSAVSYAFKKTQKRVARRTSVCKGDDKNEGLSSPKYPDRREDKPRDEALPLGRNNKWFPPNAIKNIRREERASRSPGNRELTTSNSGSSDKQRINREGAGSSNQHDETIQLPMPDCEKRLRSLSLSAAENGSRGILRYSRSASNGTKKKVSFVEKNNKVNEIEARAPTPPLPQRTLVRPVDHIALTHDILYRICNWNYGWIAQQKHQQQQKNDEPPPLLNAVHAENGRNLPSLCLLPVVSAYDSLEAYCSIFQSLMFHELWAALCKDIENIPPAPIGALISPRPKSCDGFALLRCESLAATKISDRDLVTITVPISPQKPPARYFGVVDNVETRNWRKDRIDPRLLELCKRPNETYMRISFILWVKLSNVPKDLDKVFTVTKVTRLNTVLKQFIFNAELARSPLCDIILRPSDFSEAFKLDSVDTEEKHELLNPIQYKAVESITKTIVCASDREPKVVLLQGPPGTGKSHVIVELISRMLYVHYEKTNKYPRILVCAPSNNAVDEIASRLLSVHRARKSSYKIVRVGVTASMHHSVANYSLDESMKRLQLKVVDKKESPESCKLRTLTEELNSLRKNKTCLIASIDAANKKGLYDEARMHARKLEQLEIQIEGVDRSFRNCKKSHFNYFNTEKERTEMKKYILSNSEVIFSTLNSCRSKEMENLFLKNGAGKSFLCCILDEASQCTEPESLTPLAFGISKLVLIGDPDQLPATVTSQCAAKNRFDQSLFNRFYSSRTSANSEDDESVMMLDTQYRMAPSICEWPSKYFYGGKLVTAENLRRAGPCYNYRVLNVIDGLEILEDQSYKNEKEAFLVAKIVLQILSAPSTRDKSVGVITFYKSQQQCILKRINEEMKHLECTREMRRAEVNTVDSFQGREKDIVIVSCVRARDSRNFGGDIGFVSSLQRLNVALTRAKESLIVCGHFQTLQINETWRDLINNAQRREVAHVVTSDYTPANLNPLVMLPELME